MSPTSYSRALSSPTRPLTLLKNTRSKVPKRKVVKTADSSISSSSNSFSQSSTIMGEAITKIPTRTGGYSVFKELEVVQQVRYACADSLPPRVRLFNAYL